MKRRNLLLGALLAATLTVTATGMDSASKSQDQAYREYLETYREATAARRKDYQVHTAVMLAIVAGLIGFAIIPALRVAKRGLEINERQQKTMEEIRDLLKKR